jgi:hypothetical protein
MLARSLAALAIILLMAPSVMAEPGNPIDEDFGHVEVRILPTVAVTFLSGQMDVAEAEALDLICATLLFQVHANGQDIKLKAGASYLFKDDNPQSSFFIPVDVTTPVVISVSDPAYSQTETGLPVLMTDMDLGGNFGVVTIHHCDWLDFGSGDAGTWSYDVTVEICWIGDDAEIFQGMYSAGVVLWAQYYMI